MASISRRNGKWRVRWRDPDGKARSRQCPTKRAALELQAQVEEACALGLRWEPRDARQEPDLRLLLRDYVDECTRVLQPGTAMRYARVLDVFLRYMDTQHGEGTPLAPALLTRRLLADWYEDLATGGLHGNPRSQATQRKAVEVLQLAWAWLYDNDESAATIPPPRRLRMARQPAARTVAPTWEEMDACLAAMNGWHRDLATVLRFTGLRVQQVMGLRWGDLDLRSGQLIIRGELGKSPQERRGREIPISDHLAGELDRWERSDEGWLIVSNRQRGAGRERMARARDVRRAWMRAGVREEAWRGRPHHAFRKGFVSGLKREGADTDAVEHLVGHSLGLRGIYTDPDALPLREAVALVPPLTIELPERQPRFEGLDPNDSRPVREITLDDQRHRGGLCPTRVPRPRRTHDNVVWVEFGGRSGGGGGTRTLMFIRTVDFESTASAIPPRPQQAVVRPWRGRPLIFTRQARGGKASPSSCHSSPWRPELGAPAWERGALAVRRPGRGARGAERQVWVSGWWAGAGALWRGRPGCRAPRLSRFEPAECQ